MRRTLFPFLRFLLRSIFVVLGGAGIAVVVAILFILSRFSGTATFPADCALVFGAAVHPVYDNKGNIVSTEAGPGIARRVRTASDLYRAGLLRKVIVSGGRGLGMAVSEAEVMRDEAIREGVKPEDIVLEDDSTSTEESLRNARPLTEGICTSVVAISDRYHLARISVIAWAQGWELSTVPAQPVAPALFEAKSVIREVLALFMFTVNSIYT